MRGTPEILLPAQGLERDFVFQDFAAAFGFMSRVAIAADKAGSLGAHGDPGIHVTHTMRILYFTYL